MGKSLLRERYAALRVILPVLAVLAAPLLAQDLAPRAYVITPLHANAVTVTWGWYSGGLDLNGVIPVEDGKGTYNVPILSYYHSLKFFGRSANVVASLPYAVGNFSGELAGTQRSVYRSGLLDFNMRFSVNLLGGPAMEAQQFVKWKQKRILGASLRVLAPTGQYDPKRLINWGTNRWAFKPELGYSQRWGNWIVDGYGGVWLYTTNPSFYSVPEPHSQAQEPVGSFEGHLSYDFQGKRWDFMKRLRGWASLDGNFWWGGITSLNGIRNEATKQTSSRIGGTISLPYSKHQSIKIAYSDGTYIRFGGNYQNVSLAWQYSWIGWPK